jgi:hypothetical protein
MGMFDDIRCEYPLPLPENQGELTERNWRANGFQTKSFNNLMDAYCIREDGGLWLQTYGWETTRKGRVRQKPGDWQPMSSYTGTVRFHDFICGSKFDYWVEWAATFVSGRVIELKLQQWEERDNGERLATEAKWKLKTKKREQFLATWLGRHIYPYYAWFVHGCFGLPMSRAWRWAGSVFHHFGNRLNRVAGRLAPHGDPIRAEKRHRKFAALFDDENEDD